MHGFTTDDVPDATVAESIRNAGRSFLASTNGALESLSALSAIQGFRGIDRSRVFAYDGRQAAILVTEDRMTIFCNKISEGLFNMSVSVELMPNWQDELARAASFAAEDDVGHYVDGAWASLVHMAPHQHSRSMMCDKSSFSETKALMTSKSTTLSRRHRRDPTRPRGYVSGFNFFVQAQTPAYAREMKESTNDINRKLGKAWKRLTKEEKEVYESKSQVDKARYIREMEAYKPSSGFEYSPARINPPKAIKECSPSAGHLELGADSMKQPGRPWPAYTHFTDQETMGVRSSKSSRAKTNMSKAFGQRWKGRMVDGESRMPDEESVLYKELARAHKKRFAKQRANYIAASTQQSR